MATGLSDASLWEPVDRAAAELIPVEQETRRAARSYERMPPGIAIVDIRQGYGKIDKTLLLLLGQEREPVSVVVDQNNVAVAARFDSGLNFLSLFGLAGGMPTRVSLPLKELPVILAKLGADPHAASRFA